MAHKSTTIHVFNGRMQITIAAVYVYVLTYGATNHHLKQIINFISINNICQTIFVTWE